MEGEAFRLKKHLKHLKPLIFFFKKHLIFL